MWEADEQYDKVRSNAALPLRPVWGQIGIGSDTYLAARQRLSER